VYVIQTQNLTRSYGLRRGIEHVSLAVGRGEVFGFLGPNGAGKTTTIRVLLGFLRPNAGEARIFDLECWKRSAQIKREIGYVPGDLRLHPWLNTVSALRIFGAIRGRDMMQHGRELADRYGLDPLVKVRSMSRGMRQKLGLILALAHRPQLLVLDEPTSSLDPLMQDELRRHLRELASAGHTIFFSSHTLSEVEQIADRVAIVREGRLVAAETLSSLRSRAGHEVTIRWRNAAEAHLPPPSFLNVHKREGATWEATLIGRVDDLTRWLARYQIADLTVGRPDLETLFRSFYEKERG
jgi:ABC-2 type transport system ATP-binding protein